MESAALASARRKVYLRALPLLFVCYIIAYIDRTNISVAQLTMTRSLPEFTKAVIGFGAGIFFIGYFLLEIPGTLMVERWSARKWICRIMVTWGFVAALTAFVRTPNEFYIIRFLLGLAEAGFFPGVIVYLTHWFTQRDRAKALSIFLVASPIAMIIGNYFSGLMLDIGEDGNPTLFGLKGWQVIFIFWGIPAVIMGVVVLFVLTDRPRHAKWLTVEEREALEKRLEFEQSSHKSAAHMSVFEGLTNPNVLMLALAYFGVVTGNYGIEMFLPSILEDWYGLGTSTVTKLAIIPSCLVIVGQLTIGWSSDRFHERRWHAITPIIIGACGLIGAVLTQGNIYLTVLCFTIAATGMKSYMPAFWSLPHMYLTAAAAAGSVGLINSVGNLGGHFGPTIVGAVKTATGSYDIALYFLASTCLGSACIIFSMPYVYRRLSELKSPLGKWQPVLGFVIIVTGLSLGVWGLIKVQSRPWGPNRADVVSSSATGEAYTQQLAGSLEDWFAKRPKIRDVLTMRLDELKAGCVNIRDKPPAQIDPQQVTQLQATLERCIQEIDQLKTTLLQRDANKRYTKSVVDGLTEADQIVRNTQAALRQP
ncbi:MAG: MFS transporter [Pirellulaceae bacterium]|nr:MFS transporter [Pirellulaceae bacterium]